MCLLLPWLAIRSHELNEFRPQCALCSVGGRGQEVREVSRRQPHLNVGSTESRRKYTPGRLFEEIWYVVLWHYALTEYTVG